MTDGVATLLVDVRVQALEIIVEDTFVTFHVSVELVGVGTSTEEGVALIERARGLVRLQEGSDGRIGGTSTRPLTFPDRSDEITLLAKKIVFFLTQGKDVGHGTTEESGMRLVALRKTGRTTVPETPVELVDGLSRRIESVDGVTSVGQRSHLTPIVRMSNGCRDEMGFPGQPFEGRWRLIDTSTAPPEQRFAGDGIGLKALGP